MSVLGLSRRILRLMAASFVVAAVAQAASAQELPPGAGFMTRFSGTVERTGGDGTVRIMIDPDGVSGTAIDLTRPGRAPDGTAWRTPPVPFRVTAGQVGQVFGVALDDAPQPNIYLTATSAFGLHRNADNSGWMDAMWGPGGGPGTVYRLDAANGYRPEIFAQVTLDGRVNSGAALGNIAYDRWNRQFYVSDLETGMIHRLALADGYDAGHFDHGVEGRPNFVDAATGQQMSLPAIAFDPATAAHVADCASGDVSRDPACWNVADFRRRVWGLSVRRDGDNGEVRLYYAVWGSQGFGNPDHATAGEEARNSVWSVGIAQDGSFDTASVRREFVLPDFFRSAEAIARAGIGHPVADLAFPAYGDQAVMLVAERGSLRNRGLNAESSFAFPGESRVLRYERAADGTWRPAGRFDVAFQDRQAEGPPYVRAGAGGGAAFGMGYDDTWSIDRTRPDAFVWMTGDGLCAPEGPCTDGSTTRVDGLQGGAAGLLSEVEPAAAFQPYPTPGPATPAMAPRSSYMIDADLGAADVDNATEVGDIAIHQSVPAVAGVPDEGPWYGPWPGAWPWPIPLPDGTPPPPGDDIPELQITKATPPVCDWGVECDFLLTITNNGPGVYDGPLLVADFIDEGTLVGAGPGWTCLQEGFSGPVICRHDTVVLAAGESVFLPIVFHMPLPIPGPPAWNTELQNCGFIVWPTALPDLGHTQSVQAALRLQGYYAGPINGTVDPATQAAIDAWRADHGLPPGGIDAALDASLFPGSAGMLVGADPDNDTACAIYILPGAGGMEPPPPATAFDLAVSKTLVGAVACTPSAPCNFDVTITNAGGEPYSGPIVFADAAGNASEGAFPAASIVPASPGMTCTPGGGGQICSQTGLPAINLAPGASVTYEIVVNVPATAVPGTEFANCSVLYWSSMGYSGDANPGNDFACVDVPLVPTAAPIAADLQIEKAAATADCTADAVCAFLVTVRNVGATAFDGPLAFSDLAGVMGLGPLTEVVHSGHADFACEAGLPGAGSVCVNAAAMHLDPGAEVVVPVAVIVPATVPPGTELRNCASVAWDRMEFPGGRDANPANDENACATVPIVAAAPAEHLALDLAVTKEGPGTCMQGVPCHYTINVTNNGPETYNGTLWVLDQWDVGPIHSLATTPATWQCLTGNLRGIDCQHDTFTLAAGESATLQVVWPVPADQALGPIRNCAIIRHPLHAGGAEFIADVQNGLRFAGYPDVPSNGVVDDETLAAVEAYRAAHGLAPGTAIDEDLVQSLFPGGAGAAGDANSSNDEACVTTEIISSGPVHWVDLAPSGGTQCVRGSTCTLDVRIDNRGDLQFDGAAGLRGALDPAVTVRSVTGVTPGLMCGVTGPGAYECLGSRLSIKPGDAARLTVLIAIPADFGPDTILHTKDMVWPDPSVKDRVPDNDRHVSTITIVDPAKPAADLVVAKLANQGRCTAGDPCRFAVTVTNKGPGAWSGPISIADQITPSSARLTGFSPSEWKCSGGRSDIACALPTVTLAPGASRALSLTFTTSRSATGTLRNCARLDWTGPAVVKAVQEALNAAGYPVGKADGVAGSRTTAAIAAYRKAKGLGGSGIDNALLSSLGLGSVGDPVAANDSACAEVAIIAPSADEPVTETQPEQPRDERVKPPAETKPPSTTEPTVTGPVCPQGWQKVGPAQAALLAAQGRRVQPVTKAGKTILCVAPQRVKPPQQEETAPVCPRGFTQVTRAEAKNLVARGFEIRQVGSGNKSILCARKRQ